MAASSFLSPARRGAGRHCLNSTWDAAAWFRALASTSLPATGQTRGSTSFVEVAEATWQDSSNVFPREAGRRVGVGQGSGGRAEAVGMRSPPESVPFAVRALSHVSLAVPDVARAAEDFRTLLGANVSEILEIPERGMAVASVHLGSACLMLMQPLARTPTDTGPTNPGLEDFLQRQPGGGVHHLSFTVDNLDAAKEHLEAEGVPLMKDPTSGRSIHLGLRNDPTICLHPQSITGVTYELKQVSFGRSSELPC